MNSLEVGRTAPKSVLGIVLSFVLEHSPCGLENGMRAISDPGAQLQLTKK
jgi:hypothetical protein